MIRATTKMSNDINIWLCCKPSGWSDATRRPTVEVSREEGKDEYGEQEDEQDNVRARIRNENLGREHSRKGSQHSPAQGYESKDCSLNTPKTIERALQSYFKSSTLLPEQFCLQEIAYDKEEEIRYHEIPCAETQSGVKNKTNAQQYYDKASKSDKQYRPDSCPSEGS